MTYRELFYKATRLIDKGDITLGEYEEMTKPLDKEIEQEPILDRDCEHCSKIYGTLGCCDSVSNKWVYSCKEGHREYLLNKVKAEIEKLQTYKMFVGEKTVYVERSDVLAIIDRHKGESEETDADSD